jgi:hypothetical protein
MTYDGTRNFFIAHNYLLLSLNYTFLPIADCLNTFNSPNFIPVHISYDR